MKKRIFSLILSFCMVLTFVPQVGFAATNSDSTPSVSAYATKAQMMDGTFTPDHGGSASNIGKLVFGKNSENKAQEWYILGKDTGVSGDNTIIFAASPIVTGQKFDGEWIQVNDKGEEYIKANSGDSKYLNAAPASVYFNHYGASALHSKLQAIATEKFTEAEQGMMNATTVSTLDTMNNVVYTTTDKLYALRGIKFGSDYKKICVGSDDQIVLASDSYWNDGQNGFWLRTPGDNVNDSVFHDSLLSLYADSDGSVKYYIVVAGLGVQPASNLNLSNVLFVSAATAATSSTTVKYGTIAEGKAMTLRLDGRSKNIGSAKYNIVTGEINVTKGGTSLPVSLVVQGKDGTTDWYYSKKITGADTVKETDIKKALSLSDIDLGSCKIWLEALNSDNNADRGDGMIYAVEAEETIEKINTTYATPKQLMYSFTPYSDGTAVNIGKLVFGNKQNYDGQTYSPQEWYILGKDKGVTGDNTAIFAANTMKYDEQFNSSKSNKTYNETEVFANHYGASNLREALNSMAKNSNYFSTGEQSIMNATPVKTKDAKNGGDYTTTDKLYALTADKSNSLTIKAGSANDKVLRSGTYWADINNRLFWLRAPVEDSTVDNNNEKVLYASFDNVQAYSVTDFKKISPAGNLDLSSVLFASAAEAASVDTATYGTISSGKAMTLRLDGKDKNLGTVAYDLTTNEVRAVKGNTSGTVYLVVQGKDGATDWYYSKKITGSQTVKSSTIKSALGLSGDIDLSSCHIWIESKASDGMSYAVSANGCSTEAELLNAIESGVTNVSLASDITLSKILDLSDKVITLDLNGHTLDGNISLADSSAAPDSILTLVDSNPAKGGEVDGKITLTKSSGSVSHLYANGGTVTGMVSLPSYAGGIYCTSSTPTVFMGYVGNYGGIHGGIYYGSVKDSCIKEKTVTFMNGDSRYALEVVPSGSKAAAPAEPSKSGYEFVGWYNGDTKYDFTSKVTENITLTAKWVSENISTKAEFEEAVALGSTFIRLVDNINLSNRLNLSDKILTLDLNGYTLKGNILLADTSTGTKSILTLMDSSNDKTGVLNGDIELTRGNYGGASYLYANGGTVTGKVSMNSYVAEIHCTGSTPTVFKGYAGNYGGIYGGIYLSGINESCIKAKTVTFMNGSSRYALEVVDDGKVYEPASPSVKDGYQSFDGWYNGDTKYTFGSSLSENVTLTAKYSNPVTYNITYDLVNGTATNPTEYTVESNAITLVNPTKDSYVFTGWSGTGLTGDNNMSVTIPKGSTGDRTYTANYKLKSGYTVIFNTNGGTYIPPKTNLTVESKVLDDVTAPTRAGYTFKGWKCGDTDVNNSTTYGNLATDENTKIASEIQLTAQWEAKNYTVSFDDNNNIDDDNIADKTAVKWDDKVLDGVTSPEREGYTFEGWKYEGAVVTADTAYSDLASDDSVQKIKLEAQWTQMPAPTGYISHNDGKYEIHWKNYRGRVVYYRYYNAEQTVTIVADDGGDAVTIEYLLSDRVLTVDELDKADFNKYTEGFVLENDHEYIVYARLTNKYGYVTYISSDAIIIDTAVPVISGVEKDGTYCASHKVTVTDDNIKDVTVAGETVTLDEKNQFELFVPDGINKEVAIVATDKAGNTSSVTVTVSDEHKDENKDHKCDYCSESVGDHEDKDGDHKCDYCRANVSDHEDNNADHICDICGETLSEDTGGGGGGDTPPVQKPIVENGDNATTNVDMSNTTSTKDGTTTATIDKDTADEIIDKAVENKSEEIVIDATAKDETAADSTKTSQIEIPTSALESIAEKTDADITIKTDVGEVTIDNAAAGAAAEQAEGDTVQITLEKVNETEDKVEFELKIVCSQGNDISDLKDGNVKVTVAISDELKGKNPVCVYIDSEGTYHKMDGSLNEDGTFTFTAGIFSTYAIMPESEADAVIGTYVKDITEAKVSGIASKTYTGKAITQKPTVTLDGEKLVKDTDYELKYSKNVSVGTATVKIVGKGKYKGTITKTFRINPKGTSIKSVKGQKKAIKVTWKKQLTKMSKKSITGYQIQYSTTSSFKKGTVKTKTVKFTTKVSSKTISKLKANKKYYVKVRTYKKVSGKNYYSSWSKVKTVKTK